MHTDIGKEVRPSYYLHERIDEASHHDTTYRGSNPEGFGPPLAAILRSVARESPFSATRGAEESFLTSSSDECSGTHPGVQMREGLMPGVTAHVRAIPCKTNLLAPPLSAALARGVGRNDFTHPAPYSRP